MRKTLHFLSAIAVPLAACDVAGTVTGPPASDHPVIQQQSVWLSLGGGQVRVLDARPVTGAEQIPPRLSGRVLRYELLGDAGVVARGSVEDPREVMVEWSEDGVALQNAVASRTDPMVRVTLPAVDGELLLHDDSGFIGSTWVIVEPPSPQELDSIGAELAPVLVSGGGDSASALDVLFLPDGYTAGELARFAADVDDHVNVLFSNPDWAAYRGGINLWRLDVPSNQSGIGEAGVPLDTAFGVARSTAITRLIQIASTTGQAAADQAGRRVGAEKVVVIANTAQHGGAGGPIPVVARVSPDALGHELGHSLLHLADEYSYYGGGGCDRSQPEINVAFSASPSQIPWANLIASGTPLPTPDSAPPGTVGAFQGADYCQTGAYRPEHDCLMRSLGAPMCAVCRATLDRYMTGRTDGSGGDGSGEDSCYYTCHDYGYAPGQCYQGWQCDGYCLVNRGTCEGGSSDPDAETGGSCEYSCADYSYAAGQCHEGWQCLADGCLHDIGTCPDSDAACEYSCAEYDYAAGECYEGWTCDGAGDCLLYTGGC
ncbi:MAG TPA: M64 family metallopeptidase [Kofleriaceae bacterium]|nr:M64 family metallopeptidase [Kofleriaceae bacterium]